MPRCCASAGVPTAPVARLVVGSGDVRDFALDDILPVYLARRARLDALLARPPRVRRAGGVGRPAWLACGRCEVVRARGRGRPRPPPRRRRARARPAAAASTPGVTTIDELAVRTEPGPDVRGATLDRLREQARLQLEQERDPDGGVRSEVIDPDTAAPDAATEPR